MEIVHHDDTLYIVKWITNINKYAGLTVDELKKEHSMIVYDIILKKLDNFYFCEKILEAEFEEIEK